MSAAKPSDRAIAQAFWETPKHPVRSAEDLARYIRQRAREIDECPDEGCPHYGTPHGHPPEIAQKAVWSAMDAYAAKLGMPADLHFDAMKAALEDFTKGL